MTYLTSRPPNMCALSSPADMLMKRRNEKQLFTDEPEKH